MPPCVSCIIRKGSGMTERILPGDHVFPLASEEKGEIEVELPLLTEGYTSLDISREDLEALRKRRPLGANLRRDLCTRSFGELLGTPEGHFLKENRS